MLAKLYSTIGAILLLLLAFAYGQRRHMPKKAYIIPKRCQSIS